MSGFKPLKLKLVDYPLTKMIFKSMNTGDINIEEICKQRTNSDVIEIV